MQNVNVSHTTSPPLPAVRKAVGLPISGDKQIPVPVAVTPAVREAAPSQTLSRSTRVPSSSTSGVEPHKEHPQVEKAREFLNTKSIDMSYSQDQGTGETVLRFMDPNTKKVIKQIPTPEMLKIMKAIDDFISSSQMTKVQSPSPAPVGIILNEKA